MIQDPHPLLEVAAFATRLPRPLGELPSPEPLLAGLRVDADAPFRSDEHVRAAVRDLLRASGFKPTGRSKPASEYLLGAATDGRLGPINAVVDACNVASLHSGLPISVVDADRAREPLRIGVAEAGAAYVFNASGQTIDVGRLLCLFDADGPCANAVKDAQRTKTDASTIATVSIVWGTPARPGRARAVARWYRELLESLGATTADVM